MQRPVGFTCSLFTALAIVAEPATSQAPNHELCAPLAAAVLTGRGPDSDTDQYVSAAVCRKPLPGRAVIENSGIRLTYVLNGAPLEALWHPDATVAEEAFATACPIVPVPGPVPDLVEKLRSESAAEISAVLDECLVKSYSPSQVACDALVTDGFSAVTLDRVGVGTGKAVVSLVINGQAVPGAQLPHRLSATGGAFIPLGTALVPGSKLEIGLDDGSKCEVERLGAPDRVAVRIGAYGKGLTCPPAAVFDLSDSGGDDCGASEKKKSRTFALGAAQRFRPGTTPSSSRYTSNCPDGASHIDGLHVDESAGTVTAHYHLKACGMSKLGVNIGGIKFFAEWCNGRSWLGERIAAPIVELAGNMVLEPESTTFEVDERNWARLSYFSTLMAEDFALQGFDWEASITYGTVRAPGPTRTATLNPGSPIYVDEQEERCFVAFYSQPDGGLFVLSPRTIGECKDSSYYSKFKEILAVGDPCKSRQENGLPTTGDLSKCHQRCE